MNSRSKKPKRLPKMNEVRFAGQRRRNRTGLMATTALQAGAIMLLAFPVQAQPAPTARPQGGAVVGGQASIAQTTAQTTVGQSSQRAAIDWRSFDVGQAHTVTYQQPNASSIILNRVTGPDPSQIAGRIQANGQVAIVNPSGVVFMKGSQVDVQSLIVSSANVSNRNFMAGQMVFDQPGRPDAKISNAGTISVKATGLAALVAPQVQNSGIINAKLGHVVLAGAEAHTVDLYGDGLMSVDVTRQVQKAPNGQNVLVTNSGTIAADGGTILLTARAADGIVTNLVSNTGHLRANSVGDKPGTIVVSAVGGSISIEGSIEANGRAPNSPGGTIALAATDTVALGPIARVAANGRAGGGTVAIGTTPDRARNQGGGVPANAARTVTVAQGARIAANGRGNANGGSIALLSTDNTSMAGTITARGGKRGGDGGQVEVSSANKFALTGSIDVGAPAGKPGNILIDPQDLTVTPAPPPGTNDGDIVPSGSGAVSGTVNATQDPTTDYTISDAAINTFTGNVTLQASRNLFVAAGVTINLSAGTPPQALTLQAGNNLLVSGAAGGAAAASITASGNITLTASSAAISGATPNGTAIIGGNLTSTQGLVRVASDGSAGAVNIIAPLSGALIQVAGASVNVAAGIAAVAVAQPVAISANALTITSPVSTSNGVVALAPFTPNTPITIEAVKNTTAGLSLTPADLALLAPTGAVARLNLGDVTVSPGTVTATASSIAFNTPTIAPLAPTLGLYAQGGITQTAPLAATTLTGAAGSVALNGAGNTIATLGLFSTGSSAAFSSSSALTVAGALSGTAVQLSSPSLTLAAPITTPAGGRIAFNTDALTLGGGAAVTTTGGTVAIAPFTPGTDLRVETATNTPGLSLDPAAFTTLAPLTAGPALLILGDTSATPSAGTAQAANITVRDGFNLNAPTLGLYTTGSVTQTSPFSVINLTGASGAATTLTTAGNALTTLGQYTAGSSIALRNDTPLTLNGALSATSVALQSNALSVNAGTAVTANAISIAPATAGTALTVEMSKGATPGLSLSPTEIARLASTTPGAPATLILGDISPTPSTITATAGNIALNAALPVNAPTLGLYTSGAVTQTAPLTAATLTGGSGTSTTLNATNAIGALGPFTTGGPLSLLNGATPLSVIGPVIATGDVLLQSTSNLALSGTLSSTGSVRLRTGGTFTQSAGIVVAGAGDLFITGTAGDLAPTGGTISQTGGTLAATGRLRLYSGADATFTGSGTVAGNNIEVIAPVGANTFADPSGPTTATAIITVGPAPVVTLGARSATLRLDGTTLTIGRALAADAVELHSTGNTTEPGGSITATTLTGTAGLGANVLPIALPSYIFPSTGSALLTNPANAVTTLGPYTATTGFTLDNSSTPLTANAAVTVNTGALALRAANLILNGSVSLTAPRIELVSDLITNGPGQLHIPATGSLALAPYTPGPYTVGTPVAGETAISAAQIQSLLPGTSIATLQLGGTSTTPGSAAAIASSALTTTDTLTINTVLNLTGAADTLALNARTAIRENTTGAITVGTLTGASGGLFQLDASTSPAGPFYGRTFNNAIPQLAAITAAADTSIAASTSLATLAATTITAGTGTVTLTTSGALTLNGTLGAGAGIGGVTLQSISGIAQSAGAIQTGTLSGTVGDANPVTTTGRNAALTSPANVITTLGSFATPQGNFSLTDNQALTVAATAIVTGRNVTLATNGTALAMTVNGAIGACAIDASTAGVVMLTSTGALTVTGSGAIVGGERATNLNGISNTVANGAFVESGRSGTPAYNGTITITNGLALQGGTVAAASVVSPGGINQTGGILSATSLTPGAYTLSSGQVYSGTDLTLAATSLSTSDVISAPNLTINAAPGFTSRGTIFSTGNVQLNLGGDFTQTAGLIYAGGNLTLSAPANAPAPGLIAQSGGALASANTTELYAGATGTASIAGALAGQSIQLIEPAATLTFAPSSLSLAAPLTTPGYSVQFHCPGCDLPATPPTATLAAASLNLSGIAPSLRIDASTLTLAAPTTANTVELHSSGATTQTSAAPITTGPLGALTGTAGYAATIPSTGLPTWDSPTILADATLTNPQNIIPVLGPYYTGGKLAVVSNTPTFTARDNLVAGGGQSITLTNNQPNGLLVIDGVNSAFLGFGSIHGGNFATNPHPNVRGIGTITQSTINPAVSPSQIVLTADQLSITAPAPNVPIIDARGGTVTIAPFSPGRSLSIDTTRVPGANTLSLGAPDLAHINTLGTSADVGLLGPRTLRFGSTDGTLTNAAGSITLNTNLALNNQAATLALYAQGAISESPATSATPGGLSIGRAGTAGTLTGAAGGTVTLGSSTDIAPANHFDILDSFAAAHGLAVSDAPDTNAGRNGLLVQGTVSSGTGALSLLDVGQVLAGTRLGGTIAIGSATTPAILDATGQTLTLIAQNGPATAPAITEAANSTILAGTLTGRASTADAPTPASLAYDVRLDVSTTNRIDTLAQFIVGTGPITAVSAQGAFRLRDAASLTITGQVTAKSVNITANGMTIIGDIGACIVGGAGGDITLASSLSPITVGSGTIGGQSSITLGTDLLQTGGVLNAPTIGINGTLTENGGTLFAGTVTATGGATLNSGVLHASTLNATTTTYTGGDLYTDGALTVSLPNTAFSGSIGSTTGLTINAGNLVSTGSLLSGGALTVNATDFTQTAGTIGAHTDVSILATGIASQTGGTLEAGGTLLLRASGSADAPATLAGTIAAQTVQLIEPGYALNAIPVSLGGAYAINVGPLANIYHCPGCDTFTASSSPLILSPTTPAPRPLNLRLDGNTLALGTLAADNVELHASGPTTQTGPLTALNLTGTAGTIGSADLLPVYTAGTAQPRTPDIIISPPSLNATVTLSNPANNILAINGYQITGDSPSGSGLTLVDQPANQINAAKTPVTATGLTLTGLVRAGPATDPLDATAEAAAGANINLTTTGAAGALRLNGVLAGNTLTLNTSGPIIETGNLIAGTLTGSAPSAALTTPNQIATLAAFTATTGDFGLVNARNLLVLGKVSAALGNASITAQPGTGTASVPEGQSAGTLTIALPPPSIDATVTARNVTLRGVDVIANGLVGACSIIDATTGNLSIAATGGSIAINPGAILGGQTSATLTAPTAVQVQGGTLNAPTLAIDALALTSGLVFGNTVILNRPATITGGTLNSSTLNTPNGLSFADGTLNAGSAITLTAGPTLAGQVTSGSTLTISGASIASTANLTAANLAINTTADLQQQSGLLAASGNATITAGGLITQSTPAQIEAGNTILLRASGTGPAAIEGQLAAAQIEIVEPAAALSFAPTPFLASDTHPLRGGATVTLGTLSTSFDCPGCLPATVPLSIYSPPTATPGPNRPASLRIDGAAIALGAPGSSLTLAADAVELHSLRTTTQTGGNLETLTLTGTAGYAGTTAPLPIYTPPDAQTRTAAGYTQAPALTNGTVTLDSPGNNIAGLGTYQIRGDDSTRTGLTLVSTPAAQANAAGALIASNGLTITGTVRSGPSSDPLDASASAATGNALAITVNGANQSLQIGNTGLLAASTVTLTSAAGIMEASASTGRIVAGSLGGTAGADVNLSAGNQVGTLSTFTAQGTFTFQNSRTLTVTGPVTAPSGITIAAHSGTGTASSAEGQSAGNLVLAGPVTSGADATLTAYGDLTGATPTAAGTLALTAGGNVNVSSIAANNLTGTAGQSFTAAGSFANATSISTINGTLALTDTAPVVLAGISRTQLGAIITAPSITAGGDLASAQSIQLHATNGNVTQTGGTVAAATTLVISGASDTAPLSGTITQQAGLLAAGTSLRLLATGDAAQPGGTIAAPAIQVVSTAGTDTFGASQSATINVPTASTDLSGPSPAFTIPTATTTLSGRPATVRLDGNTVSLTRLTAADTVELHATTNLREVSGGSITANTLLGTAGYAPTNLDAQGLPTYPPPDPTQPGAGTATLTNTNNILRLGPFEARSGLTLADTPTAGLTITGLVRAGLPVDVQTAGTNGAPISITLTGPAATLTIADGATVSGSQLNLNTPGNITEAPGALLLADTLSGSAANATLTPTNGNQIARLGSLTTGTLALLDVPSLQIAGPVQAASTLSLTTRGNLDLNGGTLAANTVALTANGAITETNGAIAANALTATAAQITASSSNNQIATTGALSATTGIAVSNATDLTTTGPITATNGPVSLQSAANLRTQSSITAPTVALASSKALTLAGSIASPLLTAAAPAITLQGGTITAGGTPQPTIVTAANLPNAPTNSAGPTATSGAYFRAGNTFVQTGPTIIATLPGFPNTTVRISLTSPSTAATAQLGSLNAPTTNLILDLQNGAGTGQNIRVANFTLSYAGAGLSFGIGSLDLNAVIVGSQVGTGAASAAIALPNTSRNYRINACAVGSVNCVVLRSQTVPIGNPLKELSLSFFNDQDDERDLLVPNITDQGL